MKSVLTLVLGGGAGYAGAQSLPDYVLTYGKSNSSTSISAIHVLSVLSPSQMLIRSITVPLFWLEVNETYFPGGIYGQGQNTYPALNYTKINGYTTPLTLDNLDQLNDFGNTSVYLTSNEGIEAFPAWFEWHTTE